MRNLLARLSSYKKLGLLTAAGLLTMGVLVVMPMHGANVAFASSVSDAQQGLKDTGASSGQSIPQLIQNTLNLLSFIVGAAAVIMLIIGGLRYVLSGGDSNAISGAKNTIIYAMIGIAVALFAQIIVLFVIAKLTK